MFCFFLEDAAGKAMMGQRQFKLEDAAELTVFASVFMQKQFNSRNQGVNVQID